MKGAIDTHVNVRESARGPEELIRAAKEASIRGLVLKDDHGSTVEMAAKLTADSQRTIIFGGLVLNRNVGGWSLEAVDAALAAGAKVIWMPTIGAENDRSFRGLSQGGLSVHGGDGKMLPDVVEIIRRIAKAGAVLGTGHLSAEETAAVVEVARREGVRAILVNRPELDAISMTLEMQLQLRGPGLWFERCICDEWERVAKNIRAVGVESTILAGWFGRAIKDPGLTDQGMAMMTVENPSAALGLE